MFLATLWDRKPFKKWINVASRIARLIERKDMMGNTSEHGASSLDLRDILSLIGRRKWLLIIPVILVTAVAFGASYYITPRYKSSTIVQIDAQVTLTRDVQSLVSLSDGRRQSGRGVDRLKGIFNQITSTQYARLLNRRMNLGERLDIQGEARAVMLSRPNLTADQAVVGILRVMFKDNISVKWAAGDQIEIGIESIDPVLAKDVADNLAKIYIEEKLKQELAQIRISQDFSDIQLEKYENQLSEKIAKRTNLEQELIAIQLDETISSDSNRSQITSEIDRTQEDINELRNSEQEVLALLSSLKGSSSGLPNLTNLGTIRSLTGKIKGELGSVGGLLIRYAWSDPQVLDFKLRLNKILDDIEREHVRLVEDQYAFATESDRRNLVEYFGVKTNLNYLYAKKPYLEDALDELKTKASLMPEYRARLAEVDQQILAISDMRDRFQRQQESSDISQVYVSDISSSKYRVIEPAKLALGPSFPNKKMIALMGLMLGLVLGGATVLLVELFDSSFRKVEDTETHLGLPVLAIIPPIEPAKKS